MADDRRLLQKLVCIALLMHLFVHLPHQYASAQQGLIQSVYDLCGNTISSFDSSNFSANRNNVFALLTQHISSSLYNFASSNASSSSSSDNAYAVYQCRGDLSFSNCSSCVSSIIYSLPCGNVVSARVQWQGCFLRYENYDFTTSSLALAHTTPINRTCSSSSTTVNTSFRTNLASVLNSTAAAAPSHGGFNASSQVNSTAQDSAYALAQCLGYLTPTQCETCLARVSNYTTVCPNAVAGQVYYDSCSYLFSNTPILLYTSGSATEPPTNPAISPPTSSSSPGGTRGASRVPVVVGTIVGVICLLGAVGTLFLLWPRRKQRTTKSWKTDHELSDQEKEFKLLATRFSLDELRQATGNFHSKNKLGEGGFGPVYKGKLRNNKKVAIKMLSSESHQGKQEFLNEVNLITNVQHRNLIELLGCCVEDSNRLLVYEYHPNRSLDLHLFASGGQRAILGWRRRMDILIGIAKGLEYLHEDSDVKVVHRDIKTSNILLDNSFNPKISDFGLARFFANNVTHMTTRVAGTLGYLAPEYAINGQLTEKADVYSFGLVTLEIVSGRRIIDKRLPEEKEHLLAWTWALYQRRQQIQIVDPKLRSAEVNASDVIRVVHVALLCTQTWPVSRPSMSQVVSMLCGESQILALPSRPTIISMEGPGVATTPSSTLSSDSSHPLAVSSQDISISELEGR